MTRFGKTNRGMLSATVLAVITLGTLSQQGTAQAEGSDELGLEQGLRRTTKLFVDIVDHTTETIEWSGQGIVTVFDTSNTELGTIDPDGSFDPDENIQYRLRLERDQFDFEVGSDSKIETFYEWDVAVMDSGAPISGRLSSTNWFLNTGSFGAATATNASVFAVIPSGTDEEEHQAVVELKLEGYSGYVHEIGGNGTGVNGTNAGRSILQEDCPAAGSCFTPEYNIYLNPPDLRLATYTTVLPEVESFVYRGGPVGCDLVVSDEDIEFTGEFLFDTNVTGGTYQIVCDLSGDGVLSLIDNEDLQIFGETVNGSNQVDWDGLDNDGLAFDTGNYNCEVTVTVGEFHFVARDPETSFPGMRMYELDSSYTRTPLNMFWNDTPVQEWAVQMPDLEDGFGQLYASMTSGPAGVNSGAIGESPIPFATIGQFATWEDAVLNNAGDVGNARAWGNFLATGNDDRGQGNSKGNHAYLDTYGSVNATVSTVLEVEAYDGGLDDDGDNLSDWVELCITGTHFDDPDSDGDNVGDYYETNGGQPDVNTDGDDEIDAFDTDDDGDGILTIDEDYDDGTPDGDPTNDNTDGDDLPDFRDPDDDNDSVPTIDEDYDDGTPDGDPRNDDTDRDLTPDYLDPNDDGDELDTVNEDPDENGDPTNDDTDGDGIPNYLDPNDNDGPLGDLDDDGILNGDDNCVEDANRDQENIDDDDEGDVCDDDRDGDGEPNDDDNCPDVHNEDQANMDEDEEGDLCDDDIDGDGYLNDGDNCEYVPQTDQADIDGNGVGDLCEEDRDSDGWADDNDNCPNTPNRDGQVDDIDDDGQGDACDDDIDGDGLNNELEESFGSDPLNPDTDGGGVSDYDEYMRDPQSDPLDPFDDPGEYTVTGGGIFSDGCSTTRHKSSGALGLLLLVGVLVATTRRSKTA